MTVEFDLLLSDDRLVSVTGYAFVDQHCECCDQAHISRIDYDSIVDVGTGLDVLLNDRTMMEIESEADRLVYSAIEQGDDAAYGEEVA